MGTHYYRAIVGHILLSTPEHRFFANDERQVMNFLRQCPPGIFEAVGLILVVCTSFTCGLHKYILLVVCTRFSL